MTPPDTMAEREALAAEHARAWMEAYGIRTAPYTRGGGDHPMMDTLPAAMIAFADALRRPAPSVEEVARGAAAIFCAGRGSNIKPSGMTEGDATIFARICLEAALADPQPSRAASALTMGDDHG